MYGVRANGSELEEYYAYRLVATGDARKKFFS